jgi:coenzyme F420-reducing hydrogenase beta subunit
VEIKNLGDRCTGCGACKNTCRFISMKTDEQGFNYPRFDENCTECGRCEKICPVLSKPEKNSGKKIFAAYSKNENTRFHSTSGGIFSELANAIFDAGGTVAGCAYNDRFLAEHILINDKKDIEKLRQSKYIQSDTKDIFTAVKNAAKNSTVLFCGTPCQVSAMKNFAESDNVILIDFICRGVNSPLVYKKYLLGLEERYGSKVKQVWFKNKQNGWNNFGTKIIFQNGQEYFGSRDEDPFMYGYIKKNLNLYLRQSCFECEFKGVERVSDITLGDFWGIKNFDDKNGVSMIKINSQKGQNLFSKIKSNIYYEPRDIDDVLPFNNCMIKSPPRSAESEKFRADMKGRKLDGIEI